MHTQKNLPFASRLRFAISGIAHGLSTERSLKTQAIALLGVLVALAMLRPPPLWWALVTLSSASVLGAELFNTAIERLTDRLHPERHAEIRIVKDCAAGAVLIAVLGAMGVGIAFLFELFLKASR